MDNIAISKDEFQIVLISLWGMDSGIFALRAFMESRGYSVTIVKFNHLRMPVEHAINDYFTMPSLQHDLFPEKDLQSLVELLQSIKPSIIGLSLTSVFFRSARWMTRRLREIFAAQVVWGGVHPIISPEDCIKEADIVCTGEGEHAFYEIAEKIRRGSPVKGIKNTWIRRGDTIEKNPMRALTSDLDSLPAANRLDGRSDYFIDGGHVVRNPLLLASYHVNCYPIMTSRGCMYSCSYCGNSAIKDRYNGLGPYVRRRSVDHVLRELRQVVQKQNVYMIRFWDDIFTYDERWIDEFCERYVDEIGRHFVCYAHPRHTKYGVLKKLSDAGLVLILLGVQSGSKNTTETMYNRTQDNEDIIRFANNAKALGILVSYDIIIDNILEQEQDHLSTLKLLKTLPDSYRVVFYSLCYFPKTPFTIAALEQDIIDDNEVEHISARAVNNFFLDIRTSRNDHQMFWNCIKAMAVNPRFSDRLIELCKENRLFRKRPYTLFLLCRAWLLLFKKRGKQQPTNMINQFKSKESFLDEYLVVPGNRAIYRSNDRRYPVFPMSGPNKHPTFCLKLDGGGQADTGHKIEGFQIETVCLKEKGEVRKNTWRLDHSMEGSTDTEVVFILAFPKVFCVIGGTKYSMRPVFIQPDLMKTKGPYDVSFNFLFGERQHSGTKKARMITKLLAS